MEGNLGELARRHFERQGEACGRLGSPFMARLLPLAAARLTPETDLGRAVLDWPDERMFEDALSLRFAGALHALVLSGRAPELADHYPPRAAAEAGDDDALWAAVEAAMAGYGDFLGEFLRHPPQTNETARAAALMLGFQDAARRGGRPLHMLEIGASAGLNQNWDRFRYDLGGAGWGPADSAVRLAPEWRGPPPALGPVEIAASFACDLRPLDVRDPAQMLRLRAYVWPDQQPRLQRLDGAIEIAKARATRVARADAVDWIGASLQRRPKDRTTVIFHSIFWQYLPHESQQALRSAIEVTGDLAEADAPLAWVRMEPWREDPWKAALYVNLWPGGETRVLAHCDYHGRWIEPLEEATGAAA
ncbi:MAG: hypothetical protein TEF_17575 [Rhizobiales bacterium NRL2]|nr:MAG: hypothetical protein TEF_17575 [Rhizobiales bacterium NRL2]